MKITIDLDETLVDKAMQLGNFKSIQELVNAALEEFVFNHCD